MSKPQLKIIFLFIILISYSCTAVYSTANSAESSFTSLFKSPLKLEKKVTNPKIDSAKLAVLWIGHATMLIQIDDKFVLTDPIFTETVAFLSKRLIEPGIDTENLPQIDVALISHLHPDHLSLGSLSEIEDKISELLIPEGGLLYLPNYKFEFNEIKWWQSYEVNGIKITSTPALHNGMRYGIDYYWLPKAFASFIIEYNGITIYFAGDTGFDSTTTIFKKISEKFPKIDLAILPIAPIHPRNYSTIRHTDPHDALLIAKQLNAKRVIPMHYDTFTEAFDTLGEAESLMKQKMLKNNLTDKEVIILKIGEPKEIISK